MLILTRHDVESLLTMPEAIAAVETGFRQLAAGAVEMPQRLATMIAPHNGIHLAMPAFVAGDPAVDDPGTLSIKVVTVYNDNREKYNLPTIHAVLLLHDARTGQALALMDAEHLTAMRTGAVSGVATRWPARGGRQRGDALWRRRAGGDTTAGDGGCPPAAAGARRCAGRHPPLLRTANGATWPPRDARRRHPRCG